MKEKHPTSKKRGVTKSKTPNKKKKTKSVINNKTKVSKSPFKKKKIGKSKKKKITKKNKDEGITLLQTKIDGDSTNPYNNQQGINNFTLGSILSLKQHNYQMVNIS